MNGRKMKLTLSAFAGLAMLSACGQNDSGEASPEAASEAASTVLENGMTVKEQIELRQGQLKKVGKAFKTISDQLKSDSPDVAAIQAAAASVPAEASDLADWFPEGTGPETGIDTEALPAIWENKSDFTQKASDLITAANNLNTAAQGGDIAAIGEAFKTTGGTCKACHDKYRLDD